MGSETGLLRDHGTAGRKVAGGAVAEPTCVQTDVLVLRAGELSPGVADVVAVAVPIDTQVVRQDELPVVLLKERPFLLLLDVGRHLERLPGALRRLHESEKLQRLAPEVVRAAPFDILLAAGRPVADRREEGGGIGRGCLGRGAPEIGDHGLTGRKPVESVRGNGEGGCADILSEGEEMTVLLQIIDGGGLTFVDLDLLHPGIALDVDQMPDRTKIVVHVV